MRKLIVNREILYEWAEDVHKIRDAMDECLAVAYKSDSSYLMADQSLLEAGSALERLGEFLLEFEEDWDESFPSKSKEEEFNNGLNSQIDYFAGDDLKNYSDKHGK